MTHDPMSPPAHHASPPTGRGPSPERLAAILARTWIEVRTGRRPITQLLPLVTPAVRRRLVAQLPPPSDRRTAAGARVHRVVASYPSPHVCEATVLVERRARVTALAIRLERRRDVWRVVELTAPESGLAPLATSMRAQWEPLADDDHLTELVAEG